MRALGAAALGMLVLVSGAAAQEPYPARPITIVVAFPPGGLADLTARPLAAALERLLKQPVVISNKPGAAGAVGNQYVATSKPDGYAKRRPNQIVHTSSGLYGASHVPFAMFLQAAGLTMRHLPTTGGGPMMNALLGAHADIVASVPSLVAPHLPTGKVRLLAHSGVGRLPAYPELPSLKELGYDVEYAAWAGLVAPRGTPAHILKILGDAVRQGVKEPEVVTASQKLQTPVAYQDAGEFNAWWKKDADKLAAVIRKIGKLEGAR